MNFVLPLRPLRSSKASTTLKASRTTDTLQPPPESPRRRPSLAVRAGVVKRRSSVSKTFNAPSMSFFESMFGDDFPDAFAHGNGRSCKSRRTLLDLPAEILEIVCQTLSKMDIKRLRLTSKDLADMVELRINCVYVSPNRANLDCLSSILNHPRCSLRVQEIVWDDAQLDEYPILEKFQEALRSDQEKASIALEDHLSTLFQNGDENDAEYESIGIENCIGHDGNLTDTGKAILLSADDEKSRDIIASHAASMSVEDSYSLYQKLYQDEKEIIKRGWDATGLQRAFEQLPNLRRITLTSEIWRPWKVTPIYDTPFHRALPAGYQKPSVWPWIDRSHLDSWGSSPVYDKSAQHLPAKWRGYSVIMSSLVTSPVPSLEEFVLDTGHENIGLPIELFAERNIDYTNTIHVFNTTSLRKLQLSIIEHTTGSFDRGSSSSLFADASRLKDIISVTPLLEHLDLKWNIPPHQVYDPFPHDFLRQHCPALKHIALHYATVSSDWLYRLITSFEHLETVVLDKIALSFQISNRENLLVRIKEYYTGRSCRGPRFIWIEHIRRGIPEQQWRASKQWVVLDDELDAFLYDGAEYPWYWDNPFDPPGVLKDAFGWVMDGRDPSVHIKKNVGIFGAKMMSRNPWPIDGSTSTVHPDWRVY